MESAATVTPPMLTTGGTPEVPSPVAMIVIESPGSAGCPSTL